MTIRTDTKILLIKLVNWCTITPLHNHRKRDNITQKIHSHQASAVPPEIPLIIPVPGQNISTSSNTGYPRYVNTFDIIHQIPLEDGYTLSAVVETGYILQPGKVGFDAVQVNVDPREHKAT